MPRFPLLKLIFALFVAVAVTGGGVLPSLAQDGETVVEGETPVTEPEAPATGWLQISAVSCNAGGEPGTLSILLAAEFVPQGECLEATIPLLVDGVDYGAVAPYLELQVAAGYHTLTDPVSGAARDVEVFQDSFTSVVLVSYVAPAVESTAEPTVEPAAESVMTGLIVVAHACKPDVQSADQLWALGNLTARANACPAMTLPGFPSPGGTAHGGERYFDFTLTPATGDAQSLSGNGAFVADAFCESSVGPLDNDPTNDRCVSTSGYRFEVPEGALTLAQTAVPDTMRYVAAETGTDADAAVITGSDPSAWYLGLDTSFRSTDTPVIHLFYLNPPRVNVVMHLCGAEITSADQLSSIGSLAGQALACPAVARTIEGGSADFGINVSDGNWGTRTLDGAMFEYDALCEADLGDWNGNGGDNACLDGPTYRFDQTAMGYVAVSLDYAPAGYRFGGAGSTDAGTITGVDASSGIVTLDTSFDGDVTVHLFGIAEVLEPSQTPTATSTPTRTPTPPTATATATMSSTPTRTATVTVPSVTATGTSVQPTATAPTGSTTGNGTVTIVSLYCLTSSGTSVVALAPGASASAADLGGSSCFAGDATVQITLGNGDAIPAFKLGRDGVESVQNVPSGIHTIAEQLTGQGTSVVIEPNTVTRVIIRYGAGTAMIDEGVTSSSGGSTAGGGSGGSGAVGGLVTDELISDEGGSFGSSFSGISYTSLVVEDVDAQAVSSVTDAKSLPGVGVWPGGTVDRALAALAAVGILLTALAATARRSTLRSR